MNNHVRNIVFILVSLLCRIVRLMNKRLSFVYTYYECLQKANRFNKNLVVRYKTTYPERKNYTEKWDFWDSHVSHIYLSNIASLYGKIDYNVVPTNIYYSYIEPTLNNIPFVTSLEDKSQLDWLYTQHAPMVLLRNIHGNFYINGDSVNNNQVDISGVLENVPKVVVKQAVESHGGRNIQVFERKGSVYYNKKGNSLTLDYLLSNFRSNFVVQEYVRQHPFFAQFNPSSLNTLRVMTYRSVVDNQIRVLNVTLRVGAPGSIVDNRKFGGYAIGVTPSGYLRDFGVNNKGGVAKVFNGVKLNELKRIVGIDDIEQVAIESAKIHYHASVLGFDMSYTDDNKVKIIEVNTWDLGIDNIQQANGALFHQYTDEVIEFCKKRV